MSRTFGFTDMLMATMGLHFSTREKDSLVIPDKSGRPVKSRRMRYVQAIKPASIIYTIEQDPGTNVMMDSDGSIYPLKDVELEQD
jgi:hypothetical protein